MKYIINIPDKADYITVVYMDDGLPVAYKSGRLEDFEPYTEPNHKTIEDEVWWLAREIAYGMSFEECADAEMLCYEDIYDSASGVLEKLSYQEAKVKYEAWKKQKDEIHVGDEVTFDNNVRLVVVTIDHGTSVQGIDENGECFECIELKELEKTGRHFDEIEELLKRMKEK